MIFPALAAALALLAAQPEPAARAPQPAPVGPPPAALVDPGPPKLVGNEFQFTEGPLWWRGGRLLFSDVSASTIFLITPGAGTVTPSDAETFRTPSGNANGNTLDRQGRLVTAQHDGKLTRTEPDGSVTVLASAYEGKRLNSPNDVVVRSDGSVYFTDPSFGVSRKDRQLDFCGVFRLEPAADPKDPHKLTLLTKDLELPNGLAFSPDEKLLYINDYRKAEVRVFDVAPDGTITGNRLLADLKSPPAKGGADGMKVDVKGNIYTTGPGGVWVLSAEGQKLGRIDVGGTTNVAFGGEDARTLFITAGANVYSVHTVTPGLMPGPGGPTQRGAPAPAALPAPTGK